MTPDDDRDLDAREYPDADSDENGAMETVPCPYCRRPVYEDAEQCPSCGQYISAEDRPPNKPGWIVVGFILCLLAALSWVFWW